MDDKGILVPIGGWEGYFGTNRWMEGIFYYFICFKVILGAFSRGEGDLNMMLVMSMCFYNDMLCVKYVMFCFGRLVSLT